MRVSGLREEFLPCMIERQPYLYALVKAVNLFIHLSLLSGQDGACSIIEEDILIKGINLCDNSECL